MSRKIIELSLIGGTTLTILQVHKPKGRVRGLLNRLDKKVARELDNGFRPSEKIVAQAWSVIGQWTADTGWDDGKKHPVTLINFCADMIDRSPVNYPAGITDVMAEIVDYYTRAGKDPAASYWAADQAADKWEQLVSGTGQEGINGV